jgi:hypothetical protein
MTHQKKNARIRWIMSIDRWYLETGEAKAKLVKREDLRKIMGGCSENTMTDLKAEGILAPEPNGSGWYKFSPWNVRQKLSHYLKLHGTDVDAIIAAGDPNVLRSASGEVDVQDNRFGVPEPCLSEIRTEAHDRVDAMLFDEATTRALKCAQEAYRESILGEADKAKRQDDYRLQAMLLEEYILRDEELAHVLKRKIGGKKGEQT